MVSLNPDERPRLRRRRMSCPPPRPGPPRLPCRPLPLSLEALDLSPASPAQALASLRFLVLSYLADLEHRLNLFEFEAEWVDKARDMLHAIRADVRAHLPDLGAHLPDLDLHLPDFDIDFKSHLPDIVHWDIQADLKSLVARWAELDFSRPLSYVPTLSAKLRSLHAELATRSFVHFEFPKTPSFDFDLRLESFLADIDAFLAELPRLPRLPLPSPSSFSLSLSDLPHALSNLSLPDLILTPVPQEDDDEAAAVTRALRLSAHGARLIPYPDLPAAWQNNAYVLHGYRFIPLRRWYALVGSIFTLHNETFNIHTHLVPLVLWGAAFAGVSIAPAWPALPEFLAFLAGPLAALGAWLGWLSAPIVMVAQMLPAWVTEDAARYTPFADASSPSYGYAPSSSPALGPWYPAPPDLPEALFTVFALACLASSALWHTMAGCAHRGAMEACARVDYVGIGWLIATSIATIVHHGYACAEAGAPRVLRDAAASWIATLVKPLYAALEAAEYHPVGAACLLLCLGAGAAGNVLPFCAWFNRVEHRLWRLAFFVGISFVGLAPLAGIAALRGVRVMGAFVAPIVPSLLFYIAGIAIYAAQVPERWVGGGTRCGRALVGRAVDLVFGGGSHGLWHVCIVLAMRAHRDGIREMRRVAAEGGCVVGGAGAGAY
ncbi:hemolysin-III related-domain-containing protein [Mycena maculata]|uniref:Hemolysin-III related-domain-containing protein n=1 Tax=Mycena maculata TaxID=230809 RepID=A0AAD7ID26_9AGAR|nr:hemolysin-III related-domain-containing protein [Mycena maculata]